MTEQDTFNADEYPGVYQDNGDPDIFYFNPGEYLDARGLTNDEQMRTLAFNELKAVLESVGMTVYLIDQEDDDNVAQ